MCDNSLHTQLNSRRSMPHSLLCCHSLQHLIEISKIPIIISHLIAQRNPFMVCIYFVFLCMSLNINFDCLMTNYMLQT